jgi:hypothetical protein
MEDLPLMDVVASDCGIAVDRLISGGLTLHAFGFADHSK